MRARVSSTDISAVADDKIRWKLVLGAASKGGSVVASVQDELYVLKSVYDGGDTATTRMTGFVYEDGRWDRFEEFRTPTLFPAPVVLAALREVGWSRVWMARIDDFNTLVADPEEFDRVWFLATNA